jgi:hypothetical protein
MSGRIPTILVLIITTLSGIVWNNLQGQIKENKDQIAKLESVNIDLRIELQKDMYRIDSMNLEIDNIRQLVYGNLTKERQYQYPSGPLLERK